MNRLNNMKIRKNSILYMQANNIIKWGGKKKKKFQNNIIF